MIRRTHVNQPVTTFRYQPCAPRTGGPTPCATVKGCATQGQDLERNLLGPVIQRVPVRRSFLGVAPSLTESSTTGAQG